MDNGDYLKRINEYKEKIIKNEISYTDITNAIELTFIKPHMMITYYQQQVFDFIQIMGASDLLKQ